MTNRSAEAATPGPARPSLARAWYAVAVLFAIYILSFIDRQIVNLLVDPIRHDLQVSDTQISLLQGFAFAVFYTLMGLPIAALADRGNRPAIIAAGLVVWSLMTALCGVARSFWMLFLGRVGVGIGEATLSPAAHSLIADAFPRDKITRAVGLFVSAQSVGAGLALMVGGSVIAAVSHGGDAGTAVPFLGMLKPWQLAFLIVGLGGLPFVLLLLTIQDPPRGAAPTDQADTGAFLAHLKATRGFLFCLFAAEVLTTITGYSSQSWFPSLFVRVHGWSIGTAGLVIGASIAVFGSLGLALTARYSESLARRGTPDGIMRAMAVGAIFIAIGNLVLAQGSETAVVLGMMLMVGANASAAIVPAAIQLTTPNRLRARVTALMLFTLNLLGLGIGPTLVAATTDYVFQDPKAVGSSVALIGVVGALLAAGLFRLGCAPYRAALARQEAAPPEPASAAPEPVTAPA